MHDPRLDNVTLGASLGGGRLLVPSREFRAVRLEGIDVLERRDRSDGAAELLLEGGRHNALVNQGLQDLLDSWYSALTASRITHIGLSADTSAVTASTTSIDPGAADGSSIKTITNVSRTAQTVSGEATWTQADVSWAITKIGLLTGAAATDVVSIIGGTGGSSPYNEPFTIDLTSVTTWSLTLSIELTATAS